MTLDELSTKLDGAKGKLANLKQLSLNGNELEGDLSGPRVCGPSDWLIVDLCHQVAAGHSPACCCEDDGLEFGRSLPAACRCVLVH